MCGIKKKKKVQKDLNGYAFTLLVEEIKDDELTTGAT